VASYTTTAQCSYEPECACPGQGDSACLVWPTEVGEIEAVVDVVFSYPEETAIDIHFEP
jgi:hypothetical protein